MRLRTLALMAYGVISVGASPALSQPVFQGQQIIGGQPPRDPRQAPAATGTASIRGRIFAADTGRPLRRARIVATAPELGGENRQTSTNADGRYELKDLPAGRYSITVNRSGYLQLRYGQRRPLEQGKPLQIADRQSVADIDFSLPRMSLITGRVTDEVGEPISESMVFAMRSTYFEGRRRLVPSGPGARTDDVGQYRLLGLAPGTYYVMASMRDSWTVVENGVEQTFGYAQTYFPGTMNVSDARRVTVGVGQEVANTDFGLVPGRAANISGTAVDSKGRPLVGQSVGLVQEMRGPGMMMMMMGAPGARVEADGTFAMKNVPPGDYKLQVRTTTEGRVAGTQVQEAAVLGVSVNSVDVAGVSLMTSSGGSISGQVLTESGAAPTFQPDRMRLLARPVSSDSDPRPAPGPGGPPGAFGGDSGRVRSNWTFTVPDVFSSARLRATLPDGWAIKSILFDGRDVGDAPFDVRGEEIAGVQVIVTDQVTSVSGRFTDEKGAPVTEGTVIVFADDAQKWAEDSRFVAAARPDQKGEYRIRGLPAGDYLAVAITYVEEGMWNDPEYLETLRVSAQKLRLQEAGTATLSLKLLP